MAKYTSEQIARLIVQSLDEAKQISEKNFKLVDSLLKSNQSLEEKLTNSTLKVDADSLDLFEKMVNKMEVSRQKMKVEMNMLYYAVVFCVMGLFAWFLTFYLNGKSTQEIQKEYYIELVKEGKILSNENEVFMQKFMFWKKQNRSKSNELIDEIEAISLK